MQFRLLQLLWSVNVVAAASMRLNLVRLICLAPSVFVVMKWDMWGSIAQRIAKVRVSLVIPPTKVKERVPLTKVRMVRGKDPSRIKAGRVLERRANSTNLRCPVMTGGGMMMVGVALMMIGLGMWIRLVGMIRVGMVSRGMSPRKQSLS